MASGSGAHDERRALALPQGEVRQSEQQFRATFERAAIGIAHIAPDGHFLQVNQKLCDIMGFTRAELLTHTLHDITFPADLKADQINAQQLLAGERLTYAMEKRCLRANGSLVWINSTVSLVRDQQGNPLYFISVIEDIGKRKLTEERLRRERREVDEFLSMASHELKTPLTTLQMYIQLAKRQLTYLHTGESNGTEALAQLASQLDHAERQIKIQNRLINDLLDISRIQANQLVLSPTLINLAQLVREAVEDLRHLVPTRPLHFEFPPQEILVFTDAVRIGQVVNNYLSNALKYSEASLPVEVRVTRNENIARVEVTDKGPGLSTEQQAQIWQRFYRAPGIEVKSGLDVSLGLGLHICRTIIEEQGGQVGVESVLGSGSTFWFTLPAVDSSLKDHNVMSI